MNVYFLTFLFFAANDKKPWPRQHIQTPVALHQEQEEASKPVNFVFWSRVSASFLKDGIHYSSPQCLTKMETWKGSTGIKKTRQEGVERHFELIKGLMAPRPEGTDEITAWNGGV